MPTKNELKVALGKSDNAGGRMSSSMVKNRVSRSRVTEPSITFQTDQIDDDNKKHENTLYDATNLQDYSGRRVEADDIINIKKFLRGEDYDFFKFEDPNIVFERCCFSIVISDVIEPDRIVGAAIFDDKPIDPDLKTYVKSWKQSVNLEKMTSINTFYFHLYAGSREVSSDILLAEILAYTFCSCHLVEYIIVELPDLNTKMSFAFCPLVKEVEINPTGHKKKMILVYEKDVMFPPLKIREGRENDLDDLSPLLPLSSETLQKEFGKTAMSDIISLGEKNNQSIVAEWNMEAVGIISVSTDIDYELLNNFYHLEPFHGLHKPLVGHSGISSFPADQVPGTKPEVPIYKGLPNGLAIKLFNIEKVFSLRSSDLLREIFRYFPNREYLVVTVPQGAKELAWLDYFVRVVPRVDSSYPMELFVLHKAFLTNKLKVRRGKQKDIHNVIRLLATIKNGDKILDDYKYAVCCKLRNAFVVEVKNLPNKPIVGIAVVSNELESQIYHINYQLSNHTYYLMHEENHHAYIHHLIIYPIFQRFSRMFVKEILRIMDKTCIYQRIYPYYCVNETTQHQSLLNNLDEWMPVVPRKRIHYNFLNLTNDAYDLERLPPAYVVNQNQDPFSVIHFGKKFSYNQKVSMNARIVFVGASETTLTAIERMLSSSFRGYKRITVIDPFGLPGQLEPSKARDEFFALKGGGTSMSFKTNAEWVQNAGVKNWVHVVLGTVTKIVRDKKHVIVDKERIVPYDLLVLCPGRQFQRIDCPEPEIDDPNFISFKKKTQPHNVENGEEQDIIFKRETPKPENVFVINTEAEADTALTFLKNNASEMKRKKILVVGNGLRCFACIKALLVSGINARRIVYVIPPAGEVELEAKSGYTMTDVVQVPMEEELRIAGVHLVDNYEFSEWETDPASGLVERCFFVSPTETEARISFSTFALFCYRHRRVNDNIVSALAESYIVFQDGIIIDENFKTDDPCIYAAGPGTTYKMVLLSSHQDHQFYQSEEVGQTLGDFIVEKAGSEGGGVGEAQTLDVVRFQRPFVRAITLLGGWHYMYMRSPGAPLHQRCLDPTGKCDDACECSTEIVTGSVDYRQDRKQRYFKLLLDDQSRIFGIECMSKKPFSASNFVGLYGQHEVKLNKMMERLEKGETKDLYDHFCQPWFGVFCIDHWESLQQELQGLYKTHNIGDDQRITDFIRDFVSNLDNPESIHIDPNIIRNIWDSSGLKQEVELKFLAFLKFHKLALPMYARNDYVEDLLEERSMSTLYYPKMTNY